MTGCDQSIVLSYWYVAKWNTPHTAITEGILLHRHLFLLLFNSHGHRVSLQISKRLKPVRCYNVNHRAGLWRSREVNYDGVRLEQVSQPCDRCQHTHVLFSRPLLSLYSGDNPRREFFLIPICFPSRDPVTGVSTYTDPQDGVVYELDPIKNAW